MSSAFNLIVGPMEIGNILNGILLGVLIVQAYQYYSTFDDPKWMQNLIWFILILDTVQTAVMIYMVWDFTVTHFADPAHLAVPGWALASIPFWSVPISWVVQGFFAWRIYNLLGRKRIILIVIGTFSVAQGLAGIGCGIGAFIITDTKDFDKLQPIAIIWFVGAIAADSLITGTMIWTLSRSKTGFTETDTLITKITRSVIETGLMTTTIVILDAIFFFRMPLTNMHLSVVMIAGKTYSNSMLYMLNSRIRHRSAGPKAKNATIPTFNQTMTEMVFERPTIKSTSTFGAMGVHHGTDSSRSDGVQVASDAIVMKQMGSADKRSDDEYDGDSLHELDPIKRKRGNTLTSEAKTESDSVDMVPMTYAPPPLPTVTTTFYTDHP